MKIKDIYNKTFELSKQYNIYFVKFDNFIKQSKGKYISDKISMLIDMCVDLYFDYENFDKYTFIKTMHEIDFHFRDLSKCNILSKNNKISLQKIINELYELCK